MCWICGLVGYVALLPVGLKYPTPAWIAGGRLKAKGRVKTKPEVQRGPRTDGLRMKKICFIKRYISFIFSIILVIDTLRVCKILSVFGSGG